MTDPQLRPLPPDPVFSTPDASFPHSVNSSSSELSRSATGTPAHLEEAPVVLESPRPITDLRVYSHSSLVYWWPVWVVGYFLAGLTHWRGQQIHIGTDSEWFHPSSNLGICFFVALIMVILITNVSVRGLASGIVIMGVGFLTVLFAYLGWWDEIFNWLGGLKIHLNEGAYFWFSTLLLIVWALSVFVFDRMTYWHFKPGQVTHEFTFGAGSKSYDTNGMLLEKHREDLFRHWLLGVGSGDLKISTTDAIKEQIDVPNILFIGSKIEVMQRLIAEEPNA